MRWIFGPAFFLGYFSLSLPFEHNSEILRHRGDTCYVGPRLRAQARPPRGRWQLTQLVQAEAAAPLRRSGDSADGGVWQGTQQSAEILRACCR